MLMRNVLANDFYKLKLQTVWEVVQHDLPILREQVARYLAETDWEEWEKNAVVVRESAVHKNMAAWLLRLNAPSSIHSFTVVKHSLTKIWMSDSRC